MVPLSDALHTYCFIGSILMSVMLAGSAPLLNSDIYFSSYVSNSLINVPFYDAVAKIDPSYDNDIAAIDESWHFSVIIFFGSSLKLITLTIPTFSSGIARTHLSSAVDSATSPLLFSMVIKESEQSRF